MLFTDPLFLFYFLPVVLLRLASMGGRLRTGAKLLIIVSTLEFYAYEN